MNATQYAVLGIVGLAVLGVIALFVKEKIDAAKINRLELKSKEGANAEKVHSMSDADLRADLERRVRDGTSPKT